MTPTPTFEFNAAYFVKLFAPMALDNEDIVQIFQDRGIQEIVDLVKEYKAFPTRSWNTEEPYYAMPLIVAYTDYMALNLPGITVEGLKAETKDWSSHEKMETRKIFGDIEVTVWSCDDSNDGRVHLFEIVVESGAPIQFIY